MPTAALRVEPHRAERDDDRQPFTVPRSKQVERSGLAIEVARTPHQVACAWQLVYRAYRDAQLIDDNPSGIHTVPHAIHPNTTVVLGYSGADVVSTLTIMHDGPAGLPLDRVYAGQLDALRRDGRRLMEVGLFADRRLTLSRATVALREMMRFVFYSSCFALADIVIGVHPTHARFYQRNFGFEPRGPESTHPTVRHRPVVLLHGEPARQINRAPLPPTLADYMEHPLPRRVFEDRVRLRADTIAGTAIEGFLRRVWNALRPA